MDCRLGRRPFQPPVGGSKGCDLTVVSMKFKRTPLLHTRLDFWQLLQFGIPSSHFKCRSLQVRQPVRTRFGLLAAAVSAAPGRSVAGICEAGRAPPSAIWLGPVTLNCLSGGLMSPWRFGGVNCCAETGPRLEAVGVRNEDDAGDGTWY